MKISAAVWDRVARAVLFCAYAAAVAILLFIIGFVLKNGLPAVTPGFLLGRIRDMGRSGGILPTILSPVYITGLAILIAAPLGIGSAIYLTEDRPDDDALPRQRTEGTALPLQRGVPGTPVAGVTAAEV